MMANFLTDNGMRPWNHRRCLGLVFSLYSFTGLASAELLGGISDDTLPPVNTLESKATKRDDRQIVYRVICSPEDHDLPDCDRSAVDGAQSDDGLPLLPMPDLPPDPEDIADQTEQAKASADAAGDEQTKPASKHKSKAKKSAKKRSSHQ